MRKGGLPLFDNTMPSPMSSHKKANPPRLGEGGGFLAKGPEKEALVFSVTQSPPLCQALKIANPPGTPPWVGPSGSAILRRA